MSGFQSTATSLYEDQFNPEVVRMTTKIAVRNGCCCGRIEKGNKEVPVDKLKQAWKENVLDQNVKLNISTCLGPCSQNNVSLITIDGQRIWLGSLEGEHYDSIIEWAQNIAENSELPESLKSQRFIPLS